MWGPCLSLCHPLFWQGFCVGRCSQCLRLRNSVWPSCSSASSAFSNIVRKYMVIPSVPAQATGGRMWGPCRARWCSASSPRPLPTPWCSSTRSTSWAEVGSLFTLSTNWSATSTHCVVQNAPQLLHTKAGVCCLRMLHCVLFLFFFWSLVFAGELASFPCPPATCSQLGHHKRCQARFAHLRKQIISLGQQRSFQLENLF